MSATEAPVEVLEQPGESRYEARISGHLAGILVYDATPGRLAMIHTEVEPEFEGRGVGGRLATAALDDARRRGVPVVAVCSFVRRYIGTHPEYRDLLAGED